MRELGAELVLDEIRVAFVVGWHGTAEGEAVADGFGTFQETRFEFLLAFLLRGFGIFFFVFLFFIRINPQRPLLVNIRIPDGNNHRIRGNIHHHHIQDLQTYPQRRDRDDVKPTAPNGESLKQPVDHTISCREAAVQGVVADVQNFEEGPVHAVEEEDGTREPPCVLRGEEVGVAAARVVEEEAEGCCALGPDAVRVVFAGGEVLRDFPETPDDHP